MKKFLLRIVFFLSAFLLAIVLGILGFIELFTWLFTGKINNLQRRTVEYWLGYVEKYEVI